MSYEDPSLAANVQCLLTLGSIVYKHACTQKYDQSDCASFELSGLEAIDGFN